MIKVRLVFEAGCSYSFTFKTWVDTLETRVIIPDKPDIPKSEWEGRFIADYISSVNERSERDFRLVTVEHKYNHSAKLIETVWKLSRDELMPQICQFYCNFSRKSKPVHREIATKKK